jgi:hypothetical protein
MVSPDTVPMNRHLTPVILVVALGCGGSAEVPPPPVDTVVSTGIAADLDPSAFPMLAAKVRADLEARGCKVPQSFPDTVPHNVVRGRFTDSSQTDVAVLCLARDTATILVYRKEGTEDIVELAPASQDQYRQTVAGGGMEFSRAVGVATPEFIRVRHERYGGPTPPPLDHEGINDIFVGKASIVWYWHAGKWHQLQGSD